MGTLAVVRVTDYDASDELVSEFSDQIVEGIRAVLSTTTDEPTGKLSESIKARAYGRHIIIESDVSYASALDKGTRGSQASWSLINKIIPLKLDSGKVIFRRVTLQSILRGKWRQRPRQGVDFVRKGIRVASSSLRARLNFVIER